MKRAAAPLLTASLPLVLVALLAACNGQEDVPIGSDASAAKSQGGGGSSGSSAAGGSSATGWGAGGGHDKGGSTGVGGGSATGGSPAMGGSTGVGGGSATGGSPAMGGSTGVGGGSAAGGSTGVCMPTAEICDGIDNDCNGAVDDGAICSGGAVCQQGMCVVPGSMCMPGTADCDANAANGCETNVASDPMNCGGCGVACPSGTACSSGACVMSGGTGGGPACMPTAEICDGIDNDCNGAVDDGAICSGGAVCQQGMCVVPGSMCMPGTADCDANAANGCETNVASDPMNCGGCGVACSGSCLQGVCK